MKNKKFFLSLAAFLVVSTSSAQATTNDLILLDLSKSTTPLSFDETNGMWTGTYDDDETEIESQVFSIVHGSMSDYKTWWGFTASNSTSNKYQTNTLTYQYSNMAKGGILLNEDGSIKTNSFGAPETGSEMPYLVGFLFGKSEIAFNTGKSYEVVGAYFNLTSYTFYSLLYGDGYARAFTQGDDLVLTVHGVDADENEKTVEISMASFNNGDLTASTGWKYIDLSELGIVDELYFTMKSTDSGAYGMNTPAYFCLDKLAVREATPSSIPNEGVIDPKAKITYDRTTKTLNIGNSDFAIIYDAMGHQTMTLSGASKFSVGHLTPGVYVVKSGNNRLKFVR